MKKLTPFPCTACGQCCRRVNFSEQTAFLDRGDGVCTYFDVSNSLCTIYTTRPLICRVEDYYNVYFSEKIEWSDFVAINLSICQNLQEDKLSKM
ncbi:YkgJ family cysteine cluster protein [Neisseria animaloris]|uniref:YkgJ family cysteine cluster protein n=1 Tax=Neisseria animaloris TaxID=326522 RepID=UPI000D2F5D1E|nr:YkgJ family cysteine cluster protein [Neisseria animaloris]